jgi:small conductance mechanosensitive channel
MLKPLLAGYPPWVTIVVTLSLAVLIAFLVARGVGRLARMVLLRLLRSTDPEQVRAHWSRPVRVVRLLTFFLVLALLTVPALEIAGQRTDIELTPDALIEWALHSGLRIVLIGALAWLLLRMIDATITRLYFEAQRGLGIDAQERAKRIRTLGNLVQYVATVLVVGVASLMILRELNLDVTPVLTGAGIVGLAVGFGAQSIVKDFFSGFFLILENQVRVGDVAVVNGVGGGVEAITLRTITLRDVEGTVHVFPNGSITTLANRTKDFSFAVVDVSVAYHEDVDEVTAVLREVGVALRADPVFSPSLLDDLEILGIDRLADSAVVIRIRVKTQPVKQWEVARELRRRIKRRFDEVGIEIPYPQMALLVRRPRRTRQASE